MIIIAFIVKSSRDPQVKGFYSSFILHPFQNHIYNWKGAKEGYQSIEALIDLKEIKKNLFINKADDLVSIVKLNNGISFHKYSKEEREIISNKWGAFLAKLSSIKNIKSYFWSESNQGDSIQIFCTIDQFKHPNYSSSKFIPEQNFYILVKELNPKNKDSILLRKIKNILKIETEVNHIEILSRLQEKTRALMQTLSNLEIESKQLQDTELKDFLKSWLPLNPDYSLEDKAQFIEHRDGNSSFLTKTYRLQNPPESGDLQFWPREFVKLLNFKSTLSIHISSRDAYKDRRDAEHKSNIYNQINKTNSSYKNSVIAEAREIADELVKKPYSFNLSLFITVYAESEEELQKIDNLIKQPIKSSELSGLDRLQIDNWISSLPLAKNKIKKSEQIFSSLSFCSSAFPFIKSPSGTSSGPLLGVELETKRPIFLNEYDRSLCNNRGINFIGDSGSGKTVAAKLSVKRRLEEDPEKYFYIVDNTADGWKFFIDYFSGEIIELDNPDLSNDEALFSPFAISEDIYNSTKDFNNHIEKILALLEIIQNKTLTNSEKTFLTKNLKQIYQNKLDLKLSDFIKFLESNNDTRAEAWIELLSPYSYYKEGIYSKLMDTNSDKALNNRLLLFSFSKIKTDPRYQNLCIRLLNAFIEDKVIYQKQSKTTLILDEAWKIFQNNQSTQGKELITHLARAGRGLDLGLWTISQKPSDLPGEIHSSASVSLCFQLKEKNDRSSMQSSANLNPSEKELLDSYEIRDSGICLLKTTRSSDLISIEMDQEEKLICSSNREFSNLRNKIYLKFRENLPEFEASKKTIRILMESKEDLA